jgi:acyl-CoA thioester hydrolase
MQDAPLYTARLPVRWSDMDELGHVNNAVYFTYFEQARLEYLRALTDDAEWPGAPETGPVLVAIEASFQRPVFHPATVLVHVLGPNEAVEPGRTSFPLVSTLTVKGDEETVYAEARATLVWIDRATNEPMPLPDVLRRQFAS